MRGDLRERPTLSSVALAVSGIGGSMFGLALGGFEGFLLGAAACWFAASFGDTIAERVQLMRARRISAQEHGAQREWAARAARAENELQACMKNHPVSVRELRRVIHTAQRAGIEARAHLLMRRAKALLELLERPQPDTEGCVGSVFDRTCVAA